MTGSNTNHEHGDTVDVVAEKGKRDRENGMWSDELVVERVRSEENDMQRKLDELRDQGRRAEIYEFIHKYRPGKPVGIRPTTRGAFNIVFGVDFTDGSALLRLVVQGSTAFPDEKIQAEVATMRYVAKMTTIRVPRIYHWGTAAENPLGLGPFIIMEYIPHTKTVCNVLKDPAIEELTYACIDPDIPRDKLDRMYTQIARLLLQLSTLEMPKIGCLVEDGDSWTVGSRPLTLEMNNLIVQGGIPPAVLPAEHTTYSSSDEFYAALADLHVAHLTFQRNKAVESADDCRDKFVARYLFRQLARQRRLPAPPSAGSTPKKEKFRLCIDDFRPHNILVDDDLNVVGVIDWEYAYFAPESFARDPPYWLLLCRPERYYHGTVLDFKPEYENALDVFCAALRAEEDLAALREEEQGDSDWEWSIEQHIGALDLKSEPEPDRVRLSDRMRENYASGAFWADYATRRCYGFEPVFWEFLDERFFGKNVDGGYEGRMHLLPDKVKRRMEWFVDKKLQESEERKLVDWDPKEARFYLAEILADLDE